MQEAVALAHLSVATGSGDDDEEVGIPWSPVSDGMPRLLPVPSAWWETPAVTTRALSARPEEARTARRFVREVLTCCGLEALADGDPGNETPMPRQPDWGGESGRGLQIVGALAHVWGWSPIAGHGKAVWAVLRDP